MTLPALQPDVDDQDTIGFVNELFGDARKEKRKYLEKWNRYYRMFRNRSWSEYRASWLPSPSSSELFPSYHCVPEESEALTRQGWKMVDELTLDDELLTYNVEEDRTQWQKATEISIFPFEGKLLDSRGFLATENHRWPSRDIRDGRRRIRRGDELKTLDQLIQAPAAHEFPEESILSPREAAVLGWIVTDGTFKLAQGKTQKNPWALIYQAAKKYLAEIVDLLGTDGANPREASPGNFVMYVRAALLHRIVWKSGFYGKDSLLGIIPQLSHEAAEAMWDAMLKAEGHIRSDGCVVFCQKRGPVLDAFQMLSLFLGYRVNITQEKEHAVGGFRGGRERPQNGRFINVRETTYQPYEGRVWCPSTPNGTWVMRQDGRIVMTGNTIVAWMTDQRPVLFASPAPSLKDLPVPPDDAFKKVVQAKAEDMQNNLSSWWITRNVSPQIEKSLFDTLLFGCGILKTGWDQSFEDGRGDAFLRRIDPYTILPDPHASCIEDSRYIMEVRRVPLYEVRSRFPERGHLVRADNAGQARADTRPEITTNFEVVPMANPAATGVTGLFPGTPASGIAARFGYPGYQGSDDYTKTVLLIECWVRTTESYDAPYIENGEYMGNLSYERPVWQYTAVANNVVLTPGVSNPFNHGQCPYVRVPLCEVGEFWSIPMSEHLGPAQIAMNRLLAALQTNAELIGNPTLLEDSNAGLSRTKIVNRPGGRLVKTPGSDVKWLEPPNMPSNTKELVQFWSDRIDRMSGIQAVAASLRRKQAAQTVDAVQEASFVRIRAILRNMEEAVRVAGNQVATNMTQFYIEPRCVSKIGPVGSADDFLTLGHRHFNIPAPTPEGGVKYHPLDFDVSVQAGSSLPISRQARAAEADALLRLGVIDELACAEAHDWPDYKNVVARTQAKKSAGMMPQAHNPRAR